MALNGAVSLSAGQDVTIICVNGNSSGNNTLTVKLAQGNLNAVLVSKSSGAVSSSAVRAQTIRPGAEDHGALGLGTSEVPERWAVTPAEAAAKSSGRAVP